jgi:hypothetical protein
MSDRTFTVAGVSKVGDGFHFRASNRENYGEILEKVGQTDVLIVKLPNPMTKDEARAHVRGLNEFQALSSEAQAVFGERVAAPKTPKAPTERKAKSNVVAMKVATTKEANLEKLKAAAARVAKKKASATDGDETILEPVTAGE